LETFDEIGGFFAFGIGVLRVRADEAVGMSVEPGDACCFRRDNCKAEAVASDHVRSGEEREREEGAE
jgi:hypothetical protein